MPRVRQIEWAGQRTEFIIGKSCQENWAACSAVFVSVAIFFGSARKAEWMNGCLVTQSQHALLRGPVRNTLGLQMLQPGCGQLAEVELEQ